MFLINEANTANVSVGVEVIQIIEKRTFDKEEEQINPAEQISQSPQDTGVVPKELINDCWNRPGSLIT